MGAPSLSISFIFFIPSLILFPNKIDVCKRKLPKIIVGASVSGLASAIALKSAGHSVLVLEKDPQLGGVGSVPNGSGCAAIPPNGCKILLDLGLAAEIKANAAPVSGFACFKYGDGQRSIGLNRLDPEMLAEARGGYMQFAHRDLIRILYDVALKPSNHLHESNEGSAPRVSVLLGAEVVNVDCEACSVTLRSGQIHTGDAIIGADGANGVVRRTLMQEEGTSPENDIAMGIAAYTAIVPNALVLEHDLTVFYDYPGSTFWLGPNRGVTTYPVEERDRSFRERHAAGLNVLDGDLQQMMEDFRLVFGYEAADDADEWWVTWGRYRDDALEASPGQVDEDDRLGADEEDAILATRFEQQGDFV
ncbi:hypothetical protein GGX14DRAFT_577806 [Mycena pura]|uniref:FAD-binding domain-containing protein n=1 Tax=Mycena pura TaxID=153505 RepID=A0AAD6Y1Y6_9AGAR|nr:hypothetical protein GGX14DRAFT_577806 [Mycena pura]